MAPRIIAALIALAGLLLGVGQAAAYDVRPGDTLWAISHHTGVPVGRIVRDNGLRDPDRIVPGQHLLVGDVPTFPVDRTPEPVRGDAARAAYDVRPGDTLWAISHHTGVPVGRIVRDNGLRDPDRIVPGQHLLVGDVPTFPVDRTPELVRGDAARRQLVAAAHEFGVNPNLVLALSLWESGHDQAQVSRDGAVGLMQVMPSTAQWAGPALLGRPADISLASDNARLGAALISRYLNEFDDPKLALAAYYQGERGTRERGVYRSSRSYVDGIWALRDRMQAENGPQ